MLQKVTENMRHDDCFLHTGLPTKDAFSTTTVALL